MIKVLLWATALLVATQLRAQANLEFTLGYTPGGSSIVNKQDIDDTNRYHFGLGKYHFAVNYGSTLGLTVGLNFNDHVGLATGVGMSFINQHYAYFDQSFQEVYNYRHSLTYWRVPLLLRVASNSDTPAGLFFRFGPHLDMIASAKGTYSTIDPLFNLSDEPVDYLNQNRPFSEGKATIYRKYVLGAMVELGGRIRLNEQLGILILAHAETSITSPEGEDAIFFLNNEPVPFATYPRRDFSWNVLIGLNVSVQCSLVL